MHEFVSKMFRCPQDILQMLDAEQITRDAPTNSICRHLFLFKIAALFA